MQDQFTGDHKNRPLARRKPWKKGLRKRKEEDIIKKYCQLIIPKYNG